MQLGAQTLKSNYSVPTCCRGSWEDLRRKAQRLARSEAAGQLSPLAATVRMTWGRTVSEALTCKEKDQS